MPNREQLTTKRISEAEKAATAMQRVVRGLQQTAYGLVIDWLIGSVATEGNRIKYTASNLGKVAGLYRVLGGFQKQYQKTVLGGVLGWAGRLFGLNREYFDTFTDPTESIDEAVRRLTLQRWGYNTLTKELIPGGYFEGLFNNQSIAQRVAGLVNQAIVQKMPLAQFQKTFRQVFVGLAGQQGMLERHWKTNSFDLFQRLDRAANLVYADKLKLNFAIYSGTLEEDSRPFCIARVNKIFSREQMEAWRKLEWNGKNKFYEPLTDLGGHNCRHHLSWVSDEIAQHLKAQSEK